MKKALSILIFAVAVMAADPLREIGTITAARYIGWEKPEGATSYKVYMSDLMTNQVVVTNSFLVQTNNVLVPVFFNNVAAVSTNRWAGDQTKQWHGVKAIYVTALGDQADESDRSEIVLVTFRAGVPLPPSNMQIFTFIQATATNSLPPLPN